MIVKRSIFIGFLLLAFTGFSQQKSAIRFLNKVDKSLKKLKSISYVATYYYKDPMDSDTLIIKGNLKYSVNPRDVFFGYDVWYENEHFFDTYYSLGKSYRIVHKSKKIYPKRFLDPKKVDLNNGPFSENPSDGLFDNIYKNKNYIHDLLYNNSLIFNKIKTGICADTIRIQGNYISQNTSFSIDTIWDLKYDFFFDRKTKLPIKIIRSGVTNKGDYYSKIAFSYLAINQDSIRDYFISYQLPNNYEKIGGKVKKNRIAVPLESIRPAPDFSLVDADDNPINLADYKGKVVLLDFWYSSCAPCIKASKYLEIYSQKYADSNFIILGMNPMDGANKIKQHNKKWEVSYLGVICTPEVKNLYQIGSYPSFILIDKNGMIVLRESGFSPSLMKSIEAHIQQAIRK